MKKFLLIFIPIILLIALGVGAFRAYRQIQTTPTNSIKIIQEAIQAHDAATFNSLFDVDAVLNDAAEEILTAQINSEVNSTTYSTQDLANIYETRKADFLTSTKAAVEEYISSGKINFPENLTPTQKWLKDSEVTHCAIKNISKTVINEGKAKTKIEFYNSDLRFSFELEVTLEKVDKNNWRVVEVKNFENYLAGLNRALKKKLETLNAPIREEISDVFVLKGFDAKVGEGDEYGFSKTLKMTIKADVKTEKPLAKINAFDGFDSPQLALGWYAPRIDPASFVDLTSRPGWARLRGQESGCSQNKASILARKLTSVQATAITKLDFTPLSYQHTAGLILYYDNMNFLYLYKYFSETLNRSAIAVMSLENGTKTEFHDTRTPVEDGQEVWMRVIVNGRSSQFQWSLNGANWADIGPAFDTSKLSDEYSNFGEFTGTFVGIACGDRMTHSRTADFDFFDYQAREDADVK